MTFAVDALRHSGPLLCAGLDPSAQIIAAWGLPDTPEGLAKWVERAVSAVLETGVRVVKPQVAYFERHGLAGMRALAHLMAALRSAGVYVIADAKRGDIGSTAGGYAAAWLTPGADFEADGLTVHPFHGVAALAPFFDLANSQGKTVFVLVATSNPESTGLQSAMSTEGDTVSQLVMGEIADYVTRESLSWSAVGAVVGATVDWKARGLELDLFPDMPLLAPGYGAQGADFALAGSDFPNQNLVLSVSARGLLDGGADEFISRTHAAIAVLGSR